MGTATKAPAGIPSWNVSRHLEKRKLLIAINCIAGLSIFFFGYDQGMMGGVNNAKVRASVLLPSLGFFERGSRSPTEPLLRTSTFCDRDY